VLNDELYYSILDWMISKEYAKNTIKQYSYTLKKMQTKNKELSKENLRAVLKDVKHQNQRAVLVLINNYCFDNEIDFNLIIPKRKGKPRKNPEILSLEEIEMVINAVPKPYDLAIRCLFNMGAGLRISEVIKISWNHIRWSLWISNKRSYGTAIIKASKGSKDRVVNIPPKLMNDLYEYAIKLNIVNEFQLPEGEMIFEFGKPYDEKLMSTNLDVWRFRYIRHCYNWFRYNILQKCCEKALGRKLTSHTFRHSRATYLYEVERVPIEQIQILLGHSDLNTTRIYTKINPLGIFERMKETKEI